ncbi:MAG TPA: hypothetical protein DCZ94_19005 [Lentisphaeria bacterium]|nr:MAG: hypothetical protein A2X48_08810 [Lentisphaerae bacterium GWF2_49_21]HBC89034.1 hypothetical protein [Lentisphaeria bacterium]
MTGFELDKQYLDHDFENPGNPETGLSAEAIEEGLLQLLEREKDSSHTMIKAKAFSYILDNMRITTSPQDLFVTLGVWGRKPFEKTIQPIWEKSLFENVLKDSLPHRQKLDETGVVQFFFDFWHTVPDWDAVLTLGFSGLQARAEEAEKRFFERVGSAMTPENRDFFSSVRIEYEAVQRLMDRICIRAEKSGCGAETAEALRHLRDGAAETFYEALLQIWLYFQLSEYADCIQTRSFGNLDRVLYPYYVSNLKSGALTRQDVRMIFRNFMHKVSSMHYYVGHPFYFGGTNRDGTSVINELSYLILDEYGKMGIYDPKLQIKVAENTPRDFIDQALSLIRSGRSSIVFVGEPCIRKTMIAAGYSEEEARTADIKGCYEYSVRGKAVETAPIILSLPLIVLRTMRESTEFPSFNDFMQKCLDNVEAFCDDSITIANGFEKYLDRVNPAPLFSGTSASSLEKGVDGYAKGAVYNNSNIWLMGPATATNSLAMIRKYVYETNRITLEEFRNALDADWKGYEELHTLILNDPDKFGNDREMPDRIMQELVETAVMRINGRRNGRGGFYTTALHSAFNFVTQGQVAPATPDGRRSGEEFSKNISVQPGSNRNGVTATIRSVLKLDTTHFMGDFPLDVMLHPSAVSGADGLNAMRALMLTYILHDGHAIHFNVFSIATLKEAQAHPEKYRDLQVRVCGWNVIWNNLSRSEQESYLVQAEASGRGV